MKKIILIICLLLLTGCYDYAEINDLSFISCIGIDYEDDKYKLTFEIINDSKQSENGSSQEGYTVTGSGKTIATAFNNISLKITKKPYFYHLKAMVLSEAVAKTHTKEIVEFITRNPSIRNEFYLTVAKDVSAKEIVKNSNKNNPIVGNQITKIINSNVDAYNVTFNKPFEDILEKFLNDKVDPIVSVITLDNKDLKTIGIGVFNDYEYIMCLESKQSAYLNALLDQPLNMIITKKYDNKDVAINIYDSKKEITFNKNNVTIHFSVEGEIRENIPEFDLRKEDVYLKLNKDFEKIIKKDIKALINTLKQKDSDAIGLENLYYKKYRKKYKNILNNANINIKTDIKINKKGLIFEVSHE